MSDRSKSPLGTALRKLSIPIYLLAVLGIFGCGGGGGGGGDGGAPAPPPPLIYTGNSNAAVITTGNAAKLTFDVIGESGGRTGIIVGGLDTSDGDALHRGTGFAVLARHLNRSFLDALVQNDRTGSARPIAASIPVDATTPCDSGSVRTSGTLSDAGTGTLAVSYNACRIGTDTLTGPATLRIDAFDLTSFTVTDFTVSFSRLTFLTSANNFALTGSVRSQLVPGTGTETDTLNIISLNNITGEMGKAENLVFVDVHDAFSSSITETVNGRVFDSVHGFVDIVTLEPLGFSAPSQVFPNPGQLKLTGATSRSIRVTAISTSNVMLELDLDGDTNYESWTTVPWTGVTATAVLDFVRPTVPVVSVSVNSDRSVTISWSPSSDSGGIREYRVRRGTMPIGRTTGTSFIDRSVEPGTTADYYVRAVDNAGNVSELIPPKSVKIPSSGTASFTPPISGTLPFQNSSGIGIGVADVNGDGSRDLVASGGDFLQIATALGPLTTGMSFTASASPTDFATMVNDNNQPFFQLADITGSDLPEALGAGRTLVWNTTNHVWEDSVGSNQSFQFEARAYIDLNDDGILDIVKVTSSSNFTPSLSGTLGTGTGSYDASSTRELAGIKNFVWTTIGAIVATDIDRDGLTDLIVWDAGTIRVVRQTQRGSFAVTASLPAIDNLGFRAVLLVADVTGDGYPEIIFADYSGSSDQLRVYVNDGTGNFGSTAIASNVLSPWNFSAADINGDGIPDLVVGNRLTTALDLYVSQGNGTFTLSSSINGVGFPNITLSDINLDGKMDIVTAGSAFHGTDAKIYLGQ